MQLFNPSTALAVVAAMISQTLAQCNNEVAQYNFNQRTMSINATYFIIPVPSTSVQTAINEVNTQLLPSQRLTLLPVPSTDQTLFPQGFPANHHPVLLFSGASCDIRMNVAQISGCLRGTSIYAPYVSLGGSTAPYAALLSNYVAGTEGQSIRQVGALVPNLVSSLVEGYMSRQGAMNPINSAWQSDGTNLFSQRTAWAILENPASGPGVVPQAADLVFSSTEPGAQETYTRKLVKAVLNHPVVLTGVPQGLCQRNQFYFNNATSGMTGRLGTYTLGPAASGNGADLGTMPSTLQKASSDGGKFAGQGFSACAQNVGFDPEPCAQAPGNVDPSAL